MFDQVKMACTYCGSKKFSLRRPALVDGSTIDKPLSWSFDTKVGTFIPITFNCSGCIYRSLRSVSIRHLHEVFRQSCQMDSALREWLWLSTNLRPSRWKTWVGYEQLSPTVIRDRTDRVIRATCAAFYGPDAHPQLSSESVTRIQPLIDLVVQVADSKHRIIGDWGRDWELVPYAFCSLSGGEISH